MDEFTGMFAPPLMPIQPNFIKTHHVRSHSERRPSGRQAAHKRHVSGFSFADLPHANLLADSPVGELKRTKSEYEVLDGKADYLELDLHNITNTLASRRVSIASYSDDEDVITVLSQASNAKKCCDWSVEEDDRLRDLAEEHSENWNMIADMMGLRSATECETRWNAANSQDKKGTWTTEEDKRLQQLIPLQPRKSWAEVAALIPGRSSKQCRERWCYNLDPKIKKDDWTREEDEILLTIQARMGNKWAHIASNLKGRTENAVKTRFKSLIRAKKREWRPEEDKIILQMHDQIGSRWDRIAEELPKRTKNAIKTRYRALTKDRGQDEEENLNSVNSRPSALTLGLDDERKMYSMFLESPKRKPMVSEMYQPTMSSVIHSNDFKYTSRWPAEQKANFFKQEPEPELPDEELVDFLKMW